MSSPATSRSTIGSPSTTGTADKGNENATNIGSSCRVPLGDYGRDAAEADAARLATLGPRRERFFFSADPLVFVVQGYVYRVHSAPFSAHSPQWAERLATKERTLINDPIILNDISVQEMDAFLSILYPSSLTAWDAETYDEWAAILRLATEWQFEDVRRLAIIQLECIASPVQKLILGRKNDVQSWIHQAMVALCLQSHPLTLKELRTLPLEDIGLIMSAREALWFKRLGPPSEELVSSYVSGYIQGPLDDDEDTAESTDSEYLDSGSESESDDAASDSLSSPYPAPPPTCQLSVPPTTEELKAFAKLLERCDYPGVLSVLTTSNISAFCDAFMSLGSVMSDKKGTRLAAFTGALLHRGACQPDFIALGVGLVSMLAGILRDNTLSTPQERFCVKEHALKSAISMHAANLRRVWEVMDAECPVYDDFELRLLHATSAKGPLRFSFEHLVGDCKYLICHQEAYKERSDNLRTFIAALSEVDILMKDDVWASLIAETDADF
ncbi:hypothetical protein PENSPDRAFT_679881 [Peniophora sp. CONT]|nr:hypothetical protein PENSPDRAFT_679881 [Peniophora sp. CONT]